MTQFDQGMFGHPRKKPMGCITNLPDMGDLDGCRIGGCDSSLAENLDERLNQTASWSLWAPGFPRAIRTSIMILLGWYGMVNPKLSKSLGLEQWKQHIIQGHQPYRRDCRTCVINMAGAKPHRRRENPGCSAWTMSVDLIHLPIAKDLATKRVVKYGLIATALVPVFDEPPKMIDDDDGKDERRVDDDEIETVDPVWGEGLNEDEYILQDEAREEPELGDPKSGEVRDLGDSGYEPEIFDEEEAIQLGLKGFQRDEKKTEHPWEEEVKELSKPLKVRHITLMEPVESRHVGHVVHAMDTVLNRMRFMGVSVKRLHSDRAKELLSRRFKSFLKKGWFRPIRRETTPKVMAIARAKWINLSVGHDFYCIWRNKKIQVGPKPWDTQRKKGLGTKWTVWDVLPKKWSPTIPMFWSKGKGGMIKVTLPPFVEAKLLCPSPDMTSGWLVQTKTENQVMHAREVVLPDPLSEQARIQLEEEEKPGKPTHRLWGKQSPPGSSHMKLPPLPRLDRGGEYLDNSMDFEKDLEKEFEKLEEECGLLVVERSEVLGGNGEGENEPQRNDETGDEKRVKRVEVSGTEPSSGGELISGADLEPSGVRPFTPVLEPSGIRPLTPVLEPSGIRPLTPVLEPSQIRPVTPVLEPSGIRPLTPVLEPSGGDVDTEIVRSDSWENLESYLGWMHQNTIRFLQDLVDLVPTNKREGEMCAFLRFWIEKTWSGRGVDGRSKVIHVGLVEKISRPDPQTIPNAEGWCCRNWRRKSHCWWHP